MNWHNFADPRNIDSFPRQSFVPEDFHHEVEVFLTIYQRRHEKYERIGDGLDEMQKKERLMDSTTHEYLRNLISAPALEPFYTYVVAEGLEDILVDIMCLFEGLLRWKNEPKTSGAVDAVFANKIVNYINKIIKEIRKSNDLQDTLQGEWEEQLSEIILKNYDDGITSESRKVLGAAKDIILSGEGRVDPQYTGEIESGTSVSENFPPHILSLFYDLRERIEKGIPEIHDKPRTVKKANAGGSIIYYSVRELNRIMNESSMRPHKHIKFIQNIISCVMEIDLSDYRIRGIRDTKS